jgi:hypothetical protein
MAFLLRSTVPLVSLAILLPAGIGQAQDPYEEHVAQLLDNAQLLTVSFTLDRSDYLPDEAAVIVLKIKNPTANPLTVVDPVYSFNLLSVQPDGMLKNLLVNDHELTLVSNVPETTFQPGEERVVQLNSFKATSRGQSYSPIPGGIPQEPGLYQLEYNYGPGAKVQFRVVQASLGQQSFVRLPTIQDPDSPSDTLQQFRWAFELKEGNVSHICLSRITAAITGDNPDWSMPLQTVNGWPDIKEPYKRIADTTAGVASIQLTTNVPGDQFTVNWTDSGGNQHSAVFDADLNPVGSAPLPTAIGGNIGATSGPRNARVWVFNIGNNGPGWAMAAQVTNLVFQQTSGAACTPVVTSQLPALAGDIAPKAFGAANVTIDLQLQWNHTLQGNSEYFRERWGSDRVDCEIQPASVVRCL